MRKLFNRIARSERGFIEAFGLGVVVLIMLVGVGVAVVNFANQSRAITENLMLTTAVQSQAQRVAGKLTENPAYVPTTATVNDTRTGITTKVTVATKRTDANGDTKYDLTVVARWNTGHTTALKRVVTLNATKVTHIVGFDPATNQPTWAYSKADDATARIWWNSAAGSVRKLTAAEEAGAASAPITWATLDARGGIDSNGKLWMWGANTYGEVGDNTTTTRDTPVNITPTVKYKSLITLPDTTFAIDETGKAYAWGRDTANDLIYGNGTNVDKWKPTALFGGAPITSLDSNGSQSYMIDGDLRLRAWGSDTGEALGGAGSPQGSLPGRIAVGSVRFSAVQAGLKSGYALTIDDDLYAWGSGNIGLGVLSANQAPKLVKSGTKFFSVIAGPAGTVFATERSAGTTNGSVWAWGENSAGQVGDSTTVDRFTPIKIGVYSNVFTAGATSFAVNDKGTLYAWGTNGGRYGSTATAVKAPAAVSELASLQIAELRNGNGSSVVARTREGAAWVFNPGGVGIWKLPVAVVVPTTTAFKMPAPAVFGEAGW